ncbi:MAG: ATP-binding protein [Betaproteobacteria bacterium]|nr:ATP-binding protein [Betaproteobacteria bacterium]
MVEKIATVEYAQHLGGIASAFGPEALSEEDLQKFYSDDTMPTRMGDNYVSPMNDIYNSCMQPRRQNAHLLLGHRGCGKSTELNVLKQKLEESGHQVSVIQCNLEADLNGMAYWDLLILLGKHLCKIAKKSGCVLPTPLLENIVRFWNEEEVTDTTKKGVKAKVSVGTPKILSDLFPVFLNLSAELKYGYNKKTEIRNKLKQSSTVWIGYMEEISGHIRQHLKGKQPIIIFEDLDKLSPEKAWDTFDNGLSKMPFPVIYTFPISLSYDPRFTALRASFNVEILPMIKIRKPDCEPFTTGIDTIKVIVKKRANFSLFDEGALTLLINKTGGILRDLFKCIMKAANRAENRSAIRIEQEDAQSALNELGSSLTRQIERKHHDLLEKIYRGGKYKHQIEDKAMLLEMMQGHIVLEYNGDRWHDLHPLVEDFLKKHGELE